MLRFSKVCCPAMENTIIDVHMLVPSPFCLVLDFIVVSYRKSSIIDISEYVTQILLVNCFQKTVIEMPYMQNFNL